MKKLNSFGLNRNNPYIVGKLYHTSNSLLTYSTSELESLPSRSVRACTGIKTINYKNYSYKETHRCAINQIKKGGKQIKGVVGDTTPTHTQKTNILENRTYNFQKRLYTSYSKFTEVKLVTIGIASPLRILQWAEKTLPNGKIYGEVLNANTLHHKTFKPQKGGLFCERIFGPLKDFQCACGKIDKTAKYSIIEINKNQKSENSYSQKLASPQKTPLEENIGREDINQSKKSLGELGLGLNKDKKTTRKLRKFCPDCDIEYTWSVIRRYQLGYIKLISPVTHVWFLKGTPSYLSILLDIKKRHLQSITYCSETFTIEHSESGASALQTYKTSGFDLDSPSKIYDSWLKAKNMGVNVQSLNETGTSASKKLGNSSKKVNNVFSLEKTSDFYKISEGKKSSLGAFLNFLPFLQKKKFLANPDLLTPESDKGDTDENFLKSEFPDPTLTSKSKRKNIYLDGGENSLEFFKTKRLNTINNWKKTQSGKKAASSLKNIYLKKEKTNRKSLPITNFSNLSTSEGNKFHEEKFPANYKKNFSRSKTPQLLYLLQKPKKENLTINLYKDILTDLDVVDKESSYLILQFIYILQLGFIYNNFIQSILSEKIFNIETFLIQKRLYEQQTIENPIFSSTTGVLESDHSFVNIKNSTEFFEGRNIEDLRLPLWKEKSSIFASIEGKDLHKSHLDFGQSPPASQKQSSYYNSDKVDSFQNYSSFSDEPLADGLSTSAHLINKINKKSPMDIYIKAYLQRMLHKKIIMYSIVKTWQNVYKKAYIKAMYKITSYFYQTNKIDKISLQFSNKRGIFEYEDFRPLMSAYTSPFLHYYNINKIYAKKNSMKMSKNIIQLVKSFFKKNVLLTLQNIKQPIFSFHLNNTKKYTIKNISEDKVHPPGERILFPTSDIASSFGDDSYTKAQTNPPRTFSTVNTTDIPIPYSVSQLINKKTEEMTDFLSLDLFSLVDLLAQSGFTAPLVVGKCLQHTRCGKNIPSNTISSKTPTNVTQTSLMEKQGRESFLQENKNLFKNSYPKEFSFKPLNKMNLNYKLRLFVLAKNLLKIEICNSTIASELQHRAYRQSSSRVELVPNELVTRERQDNNVFSHEKTLDFLLPRNKKFLNQKSLDLKENSLNNFLEFSQLLPYRMFKQPYSDLYVLNNGKYPKRKNLNYLSKVKVLNRPEGDLKSSSFLKDNNVFSHAKTSDSYKISEGKKSSLGAFLNFLPFRRNKKLLNSSYSYDERSGVAKQTPRKCFYNNIYTLSHRERWGSRVNEGKDWQIFFMYNTARAQDNNVFSHEKTSDFLLPRNKKFLNQKSLDFFSPLGSNDQPIFAYKDRISSTAFPSQTSSLNQYSTTQGSSSTRTKQPYNIAINNSFFSGPGIIQQLLNELTFTEMKKLDKQNRLLLYLLNKSIFKLKKHIKIFFYDKTSQIELRELCKKRDLLIRRTKLVRKLFRKDSDPSSMILTVLPVLPPDLRPIVKMGGQIAASDLNRFYQRVIYRNDRLKKFLKDPATSNSYEMKYAQRLLQEAVDNLIQNSQTGGEKDARGRALKSLSDILKGKQGRFRQFLLGKRVDYSGRSVIVVGPKLKLYQCGIPLEMALELYLPFLLKTILNKNYAKTVVGAKALIKNNRPLALELLREIMQVSPVLLNRAPTLHRLGFQAFVPKLVEGRAILLHPLVCSSFNADFDGDQMAVHVPITIEARAEAWKLMLSRNNMLSPATGDPLSIPSQDMVLGCYYLTTNSNKATLSLLRGSGLFFTDLQKVLYLYDLQKIDLHALVWVKWMGLIENGNDREEPVEIRISSLGSWQELSYNYIRHFDSSSQLKIQYMSTTPGRILFYSLLQNI